MPNVYLFYPCALKHTGYRERYDMSKIDVVKQVMALIEADSFDKLESLCTDNMVFEGPVPEPVGRKEFFALQKALVSAIPDWKFNARDYRESGDKVTCTVSISGTQTRTLSLPMLPHPVDPTRKHIQLPQEHLECSFVGDKISRLHSDTVPGGGVMGVLEQLGVKMMAH
jgi:hypothetical protein